MQSGTLQPSIPSRIGKYEILRKISEGGMAEVFLGRIAQESGFEKLVAIKRILPHLAEEKTFVEMFLDEARIAALLNHSNIAQIFDLGTAESGFFISMEYVRGVPLASLIAHFAPQQRHPPPALAAYLLASVCAGLEYAHTCCDNQGQHLNIVHRDVSPSNILISTEGTVKLIDFGIAKAAQRLQQTQAGKIKGKFGYMSPEQVRTGLIDHRSDIFSSGMVLYELLTGENPFCGVNTADSFERARRAHIPPPRSVRPAIPFPLETICLQALAIDPDARYQTAGEMELDLERFLRQHRYTRLELAALIKDVFPETLSNPNSQSASGSRPRSPSSASLSSRPAATIPAPPTSRPTTAQPTSPSGSPAVSAPASRPGSAGYNEPTEILSRQQQTSFLPLPEEASSPEAASAPEDDERTRERRAAPRPPDSSLSRHPLRLRAVLAGFVIAMSLALVSYVVWLIQKPPSPGAQSLPVVEPLNEDAGAHGYAGRPALDGFPDQARASKRPAPDSDSAPLDAGSTAPDQALASPSLTPDQGSWGTYHHLPGSDRKSRSEKVTRSNRNLPRAKISPRPPRPRPPKKTGSRAPPIPFEGL